MTIKRLIYLFLVIVIGICIVLIIMKINNYFNTKNIDNSTNEVEPNPNAVIKSTKTYYSFKHEELMVGKSPIIFDVIIDKKTHNLSLKKGMGIENKMIELTNDEYEIISKAFDIIKDNPKISVMKNPGYKMGLDFSILVKDKKNFCDSKECYEELKAFDINKDGIVTCREQTMGDISLILKELKQLKELRNNSVKLSEIKCSNEKKGCVKQFVLKQNNKKYEVKVKRYFKEKKYKPADLYEMYYSIYINHRLIAKKKTMKYYIVKTDSDSLTSENLKEFLNKNKNAINIEGISDLHTILEQDENSYFLAFKDNHFGYIRNDYYAYGNEKDVLDLYNKKKLIASNIDVSTRIEMAFDGKTFKYIYNNCDKKTFHYFN